MKTPLKTAVRQSNFALSFLVLSAERKEAIRRVYAFCRILDDISDDPGPFSEKTKKLKEWQEELSLCYSGTPTRPVTKSLQASINRFKIPRAPFEDLIKGVETDLTFGEFSDFSALAAYCYRVAGTVGLMCLPIFGCPEEKGRDYAISLGTALQLTNILRDVREDAERGRIYIPLDELRRFGYSREELFESAYTPAFVSLMNFQAERAAGFYRKASREIPKEYRGRLLSAEIMASFYFSLLRKIKKHRFQVFKNRFHLSKPGKVGLALHTVLLNRTGWHRRLSL